MKTLFKETQRFSQWWLWLILIGIAIIPIYAIIVRMIDGNPFMHDLKRDLTLIILSQIIFILIYFFARLKLITIIDKNEIRIIYKPFVKKVIRWSDVQTAKIINYRFVGSWGVGTRTKHGPIYNTNGKTGLSITTKSGNRFVVGTQKENELKKIIDNILALQK